jgi:hypothetical protein
MDMGALLLCFNVLPSRGAHGKSRKPGLGLHVHPVMKRYANSHGHSGVVAYSTTPTSIIVRFTNGERYEYSNTKPGRSIVAHMKALAASGRGLSTFIAQHVRENYERRL